MKNRLCPRIKSTSLTFRIVNMIYVLGPQNRAQINIEMGIEPYMTYDRYDYRHGGHKPNCRRVDGKNNCQLATLRRMGILEYSTKTRKWSLGPKAHKLMKDHPELWGDID